MVRYLYFSVVTWSFKLFMMVGNSLDSSSHSLTYCTDSIYRVGGSQIGFKLNQATIRDGLLLYPHRFQIGLYLKQTGGPLIPGLGYISVRSILLGRKKCLSFQNRRRPKNASLLTNKNFSFSTNDAKQIFKFFNNIPSSQLLSDVQTFFVLKSIIMENL